MSYSPMISFPAPKSPASRVDPTGESDQLPPAPDPPAAAVAAAAAVVKRRRRRRGRRGKGRREGQTIRFFSAGGKDENDGAKTPFFLFCNFES